MTTLAVIDPVGLSIKHFIEAWRTICAGSRAYADESPGDLHFIFSGVPIPFFNIGILTGRQLSAEALRAAGQQACEWASKHAVPWLFVTTTEALLAGTDADAALEACGLAPLMPLTGMIAQQVAPPSNVPAELRLLRANDDHRCSAILDINSLAYDMDLAAAKEILGTRAFWSGHFGALGLVEGDPASAAAVVMVDGHRYVLLVATKPTHQKRGYGEAVMRHALDLSAQAHGNGPSTLHATEAGRPIYERMGYVPIATHTIYIEKKFLEGH
jgi:ribosomal protein S18 acetylase RimI-like enzyme